jgi:SAM-dependent methyltransferase
MIEAARNKSPRGAKNLSFVTQDYGDPAWTGAAAVYGKFDVIVSGLSINHQADKRKKEIYKEIFGLLKPGGLFLNFEHVSSPTPRLKRIWDEFFIDSIYRYHRTSGSRKTRAQIAKKHYHNPLIKANILTPVDAQCAWLRSAGFREVDCYLKIFELAIFGGVRPR